jgi:hypothetical protein
MLSSNIMTRDCSPRSRPKQVQPATRLQAVWSRIRGSNRRDFIALLITVFGGWAVKWLPGPKDSPVPLNVAVSDGLKIDDAPKAQVIHVAAIPSRQVFFAPGIVTGSAKVKAALTVEHLA